MYIIYFINIFSIIIIFYSLLCVYRIVKHIRMDEAERWREDVHKARYEKYRVVWDLNKNVNNETQHQPALDKLKLSTLHSDPISTHLLDQTHPTFSSIFTVFYRFHWEARQLRKKGFAEKLKVHTDTVTNWMNHLTNIPPSEKIIEAGHILNLPLVAIDALLVIAGHNPMYGSSHEQALEFAQMVANGGYSAFQQGAIISQTSDPIAYPPPIPSNRESRKTIIYIGNNAHVVQHKATLKTKIITVFSLVSCLVSILVVFFALYSDNIRSNNGLAIIPPPPMSIIYVHDPLEPDVNEVLDIVDGELIDQQVMEYKDKINYLSTATKSEVKSFYDEKLADYGWTSAKYEDQEYGLTLAYGNPDDKWTVLVMYLDLRSYGRDDALVLVLQTKERGK